MDESTGSTVFDSSGNGHTGTNTSIERTDGLWGETAYDLTSSTALVDVPNATFLQGVVEGTISLWLRSDSNPSGDDGYLSVGSSGTEFTVFYLSNGGLKTRFYRLHL